MHAQLYSTPGVSEDAAVTEQSSGVLDWQYALQYENMASVLQSHLYVSKADGERLDVRTH